LELIEPPAELVTVTLQSGENGTRAVNKDVPQIRIPALADAEQLRLSAGRMLFRH